MPRKTNANSEQPEELPLHLRWKEVEHADTDVIVSVDDLYKELVPTWMGDNFDPEAMNAATGNAFDCRHHVKGEGAKSKADFKNIISHSAWSTGM
jgi:hypothetical protein